MSETWCVEHSRMESSCAAEKRIAELEANLAEVEKDRNRERRMKEHQRKLVQDAHGAFHEAVKNKRGIEGMHDVHDEPAQMMERLAKQREAADQQIEKLKGELAHYETEEEIAELLR